MQQVHWRGFSLVIGLMGISLHAQAQATPNAEPVVKVTGNVVLASDYIWRGVSQTWAKPALQATIEAAHVSGFYAGFFGSNVSSYFVPGGSLETDWYGGYRGKAGDFSFDVNAMYIYYPGSDFDKATATPAFASQSTASMEVYANLG